MLPPQQNPCKYLPRPLLLESESRSSPKVPAAIRGCGLFREMKPNNAVNALPTVARTVLPGCRFAAAKRHPRKTAGYGKRWAAVQDTEN